MIPPNLAIITLLLFSLFSQSALAQHLFPEKYYRCNIAGMTLEQDTAKAKKDPSEFIELFTSSTPEATRRRLEGRLTMQIVVYQDGSNCLLSVENNTTVTTEDLGLKTMIDKKLRWFPHKDLYISTIVELTFDGAGEVVYRRLGFDFDRGLHELKYAGALNIPKD